MESEPQNPTQISGDDEEFYEKIEAPKFVDFTTPDHHRPDDRFWFCLRVGCDRKHEEEIDHEAISKDFVLRVMAARSPNVRFRKVLSRNTHSIKDKCPLSEPAKPTKSRLSKLAVISSISQKIFEMKTKPISKSISTPKLPKGKQVAAKYLTTPRHKICSQNTNNNSFRSVQNPKKPTNIAVPKNKIVAKSLFQSPKRKGICVKTSAELRTPLTKICEGIKKLEIASQRKRVLGYSSTSTKEIKQKSNCKDKSKGSLLKNKSSDIEIDTKFKISESNTNTDLEENEIGHENLEAKKERVEKIGNSEEKPTKSENLEISENKISNENLEDKKENVEKIENPKEEPIKSENLENDDKENASALDYNRSCETNTPGKSGTKVNKKVVNTQDKNLKEGLKTAATSAQVGKYKKPKPTNPKPFRLRTDERGVLREANMERRAPLKDENEIEKQNRASERNNDQQLRQKVPTTKTLQKNSIKHRENERNILGEISSAKSTRKTKSPSLQPHFMMPIGGASTRKTNACDVKNGNKLTPIKDTSSVEAGERSHCLKPASKGKKPKAVTEEPNFPSAHVEKSCVKKVAWAVGV